MSKLRFTDAEKWRDPWYQGLPLIFKALWQYLLDNCDNAGVWICNEREAEFHIGEQIDWKQALVVFEGRVSAFSNARKWHIVKFISFQYPGGLSPLSAPHRQVIRLCEMHGLPLPILKEKKAAADGSLPSSLPSRLQASAIDTDTDTDKDSLSLRESPERESFLHAIPDITPPAIPPAANMLRAKTVGDLQAVHPVLVVFRTDQERLQTILALYGWDGCSQGLSSLEPSAKRRETGKQRVTVNELAMWLAKTYELDPEDYRRAGLPMPAKGA